MAFDFLKIKKAVQDAAGEIGERKARIEKLRQERDQLAYAPLAKKDVIDILHEGIDRDAQRYLVNLRRGLNGIIDSPGMEITPQHPIPTVQLTGNGVSLDRWDSANFCWLFRDQMKKGIAKAVEAMEWPEDAGPLMSERRERVDAIEKELAIEERELKEILEQADAAGLRGFDASDADSKADGRRKARGMGMGFK